MAHVLFLLHGMGTFQDGWEKEDLLPFLDGRCKDVYGQDLQALGVDVRPLTYDTLIQTQVDRWKEEGKALADLPGMASLAGQLQAMGEHDFLHTHVQDVVLFAADPSLRDLIVVDLAAKILQAFKEDMQRPVSLMAHSLGTAVADRVLDAIWRDPDLGGGIVRLRHLFLVANVSRALRWPHPEAVYAGGLQPGGTCAQLHACAHQWDLLTRVLPFDPPPAGFPDPALPPTVYETSVLDHLDPAQKDCNVHAWLHYLRHPRLHLGLLEAVIGQPLPDRVDRICDYSEAHPLSAGLRTRLQTALHTADLQRLEGLQRLLLWWKQQGW